VLHNYWNIVQYKDTFSSKIEAEWSVFTFKSNFWTISELLNMFKCRNRVASVLLSVSTSRSGLPYKIWISEIKPKENGQLSGIMDTSHRNLANDTFIAIYS